MMKIYKKDERKIRRKQNRAAHRLLSEIGVRCSDNPTNNIIICNAGQGTGLCREILLKALNFHLPDLPPPKCIIPRGKCYSFVVFKDVIQSEKMYSHVHGKISLENNGPKLCLSYTMEVDEQVTICSHSLPQGLKIYENFIDKNEEILLLDIFDWSDEIQETGSLKNRQVKHYGYEFRYGTNDVDLNNPLAAKIPSECDFLFTKLTEHGYNIIAPPDQLTVNRYKPGHGIPSHVDTHSPFGPQIMSLSLGSPVVMDWRHSNGIHVPVRLPNRSMLVMESEARYDWFHGIASRTWDPEITLVQTKNSPEEKRIISDAQYERGTRISLTFRWTRAGPCTCIYPRLCDSKAVGFESDGTPGTRLEENDVAVQLEDLHVHQVYDKIAPHFSSTRHKAWPRVVDYVAHLQSGTVLLDLGSGNGKNMICRNDLIQIAIERSSGLLVTCKETCKSIPGADCFRSDILSVPLRDQCADAIICIAVLHHFSNEDRRVNSLKELARLLKTNGTALITVWAKDQSKANYLKKGELESVYEESSKVHTVAVTGGGALPVHENRTQFKHSDLLVPWKLRNVQNKENQTGTETLDILLRYYHVFEEGELDRLCLNIPMLKVKDSFYEQGNWCVVCEKL